MSSWLPRSDDLSPVALTVRAQTLPLDDDGRLLWSSFMPRADVGSVRLSEITQLDFRPAASRREWNQRGRVIPLRTPPTRDFEMVPIEARFSIGEREMQRHVERGITQNAQLWAREVGLSIDQRVFGEGATRNSSIVMALYRALEVEVFEAWALGQVTALDPQTSVQQVMSFGFDAARYTTAGTAWDDGGVNAYEELMTFLQLCEDLSGEFAGVMMRRATFFAIQADAPNPMPGAQAALQTTQLQIEQMIAAEFGLPSFSFLINERSVDVPQDSGDNYVRTKVWPAQRVAAVPPGGVIGSTKFAPVTRAAQLDSRAPDAGIDINGATVYFDEAGMGREFDVEAQINALPIPDEQLMCVIDAGV